MYDNVEVLTGHCNPLSPYKRSFTYLEGPNFLNVSSIAGEFTACERVFVTERVILLLYTGTLKGVSGAEKRGWWRILLHFLVTSEIFYFFVGKTRPTIGLMCS